ncbi:MAG: prohibitin family protein [FCB group bacterium]|jgi:regulator of protease activity HflC (stomatin/prohibitin superfamily)
MALIILGIIVLIIAIGAAKPGTSIARFKSMIIAAGVILIAAGVLFSSVKQINAGHVGVQVLFGKVESNVLYAGLNVINPLYDVKQMSIQTQNYTMSATTEEGQVKGDDAIHVLSLDGLEVIIDMTILYRITPSEAPNIYKEIGMDYEDKVIRPIARTGIRGSASYFNAIDLFATQRDAFTRKIRDQIEAGFTPRGIVLEQLLVRDIKLPTSVKESIEHKITAVQDAQRMEYVLQKERQEAERKRVEAQGVADAQKIVNAGLSDKILQFEMIKVQKELVNSPNSKIIVLGGGKGNLPFMIGDGK